MRIPANISKIDFMALVGGLGPGTHVVGFDDQAAERRAREVIYDYSAAWIKQHGPQPRPVVMVTGSAPGTFEIIIKQHQWATDFVPGDGGTRGDRSALKDAIIRVQQTGKGTAFECDVQTVAWCRQFCVGRGLSVQQTDEGCTISVRQAGTNLRQLANKLVADVWATGHAVTIDLPNAKHQYFRQLVSLCCTLLGAKITVMAAYGTITLRKSTDLPKKVIQALELVQDYFGVDEGAKAVAEYQRPDFNVGPAIQDPAPEPEELGDGLPASDWDNQL
jgi:hypothetical protein